jgi:hypothetical protein
LDFRTCAEFPKPEAVAVATPTLGKISASLESSTRSREFISLARALALSGGSVGKATSIANDARLSPAVKAILADTHKVHDLPANIKAAVSAGTTADATWAEPLAQYQNLANSFLESLRTFGGFDRMLGAMRRVPLRTRIGASTAVITAGVVPQGHVKNVSKLSLTGNELDEIKVACILIVTQELAKFGSGPAGDLFSVELSNAISVATDEEFIRILTAGAVSTASSGSTAEHIRHDLRVLLSNVTTTARSRLFLLTSSTIAKTLSILHTNSGAPAFPGLGFNGGQVGGIEVIATDGAPSGVMLLVDAQQVAAGSETIQLSSAEHASVQMDSAPDSPASAATNLVSLWQMDMVGLRAERFFGAEKLNANAASLITGVSVLGDSPGP